MSLRRTLHRPLVFGLALAVAAPAAGCESGSRVEIDDVTQTRLPEDKQIVEVRVLGYNQIGGKVGPYCVSAHWFEVGTNLASYARLASYKGTGGFLEETIVCFGAAKRGSDETLCDGGEQTVQLRSEHAVPSGASVRIQLHFGVELEVEDLIAP